MSQMTVDDALRVGFQHQQAGRLSDAEAIYKQVLASYPNHAPTIHLMGVLESLRGNPQTAVDMVRRAISIEPQTVDYYNTLGVFLTTLSKLDEAAAVCRQAIQLRPDYPQAYQTLGNALRQQGDAVGAATNYATALKLNPNLPEACNNLGIILAHSGQIEQSIALLRHAIKLIPNWHQAWNNLGTSLLQSGRVSEAISTCRHALQLSPNFGRAASNLAFFTNLDASCDEQTVFEAHRQWDRVHSAPLLAKVMPHRNDRSPDRPLRIGYVSPDLREHSVSYFIEPLLAHHDSQQVQVVCYSGAPQRDETSQRMRGFVHQWHEITRMNHQQVADLIRYDQIDILVDLSGHTAGGRLPVFARKPAPIQMSYLGYPNTTGLTAMDYRLTDAICDPPGMTERYYSEQLVRLPETLACYRPPDAAPDVAPTPALANGFITFGSFCVLPKLNDQVIQTWSQILAAVPNSRLLIAASGLNEPSGADRMRSAFARHETDASRLQLVGQSPFVQYLASHAQVDLLLDPFPVNGHTITCHGLWMGVPSVCLSGTTYRGRLATSVMRNLKLDELIADSSQRYVEIAANLARDISRLSEIRSTLRDRMRGSVLMDGPRFARNVEASYRDIWRKWCAKT